jgi:hypothetical protein
VRILLKGKVHPRIGFFIGTLTTDLDKAADERPATIIGDAWMEGEIARELKLNAGLLKLPFSRHGAQGGGSLHGVDFHGAFLRRKGPKPITLDDGTAETRPSVPHRDYGVMARGLVLRDRLDYRLAITDGVSPHEVDEANPRFVGRLGVNFFEPEPEFFWKGTHVGNKKVLTVASASTWSPT